jgi:hydrogenase maturation factor
MFNKRHDALSSRNSAGMLGRRTGTNRNPSATKAVLVIRNNSVDEGIITFGLWLNAEDKRCLALPIIMKEFTEDRRAVLQDNILQKDIIVDIVQGVPFCNECGADDCVHVGFAICAEQMKEVSRNC